MVSIAELDARVAGATAPRLFVDAVARYPDLVALRRRTASGSWDEWTMAEYADTVAKVAAGLAFHGVTRGSRVALLMRNRPDFHWYDTAAQFLRAVPFSIYNSSSAEEIEYLLNHARTDVAVVEDLEFLERIIEVDEYLTTLRAVFVLEQPAGGLPEGARSAGELFGHGWLDLRALADATEPTDLATLIYTSGTTGPPKGVMISQRNVVYAVEQLRATAALEETAGLRVVSYLPMAHIAERMTSHYQQMVLGYTVSCCPDAQQVATYLRDVHPQLLFGVPRLWEKLRAGITAAVAADPGQRARFDQGIADATAIAAREAAGTATTADLALRRRLDAELFRPLRALLGLDELQVAVTGAAPIPAETVAWFTALGVPLSEIYGMSESTGSITWSPHRSRPGLVGRPVAGCEIALADDGEICCRGGNVFEGYLDDPERTAETVVDGWLRTGDIGAIDTEGYLHIVDRKKELIITAGGKNVSPANIEAALRTIPLVGQACAIGDGRRYVTALLVLDPDTAASWAAQRGLQGMPLKQLANHAEVQREIRRGVREVNQRFSGPEQVKKFTLLGEEWLPDSDVMTPTSKLKRRGIHQRYARAIERMYEEPAAPAASPATTASAASAMAAGAATASPAGAAPEPPQPPPAPTAGVAPATAGTPATAPPPPTVPSPPPGPAPVPSPAMPATIRQPAVTPQAPAGRAAELTPAAVAGIGAPGGPPLLVPGTTGPTVAAPPPPPPTRAAEAGLGPDATAALAVGGAAAAAATAAGATAARTTTLGQPFPPVDLGSPAPRRRRRALLVVGLVLLLLAAAVAAVLLARGDGGEDSAPSSTTPAATSAPPTTPAPTADLLSSLQQAGQFSTLTGLLRDAGLEATLVSGGPFTLFAPTDAAFGKLQPQLLDDLRGDLPRLRAVLSHHLVDGRLLAADLTDGELTGLDGTPLQVVTSPSLTVGGVPVSATDLAATNGVIHTVDSLVLPPGGDTTTTSVAPSTTPAVTTAPADLQSLLDEAGATAGLTGLTVAIDAAGLRDDLETGPWTLFAPNDAAFAAIPAEQLDALLANPTVLRRVLDYHRVAAVGPSAGLRSGEVPTVEGDPITLVVTAEGITVDGARVVRADEGDETRVIHVIDRLLLPPGVDLASLVPDTGGDGQADFSLYFDSSSDNIRDDARPVIDLAAAAIAQLPAGSTVRVVGVADTRGDPASNRRLSLDRAQAVINALRAAGADNVEYEIDAAGAEPSDDLQQSRRVDVYVP